MKVRGQVVHLRSVSKKLLFADVCVEDSDARVTTAFQSWICGTDLLVRAEFRFEIP